MLKLLTTYYPEKNKDRLAELNKALKLNLHSGLFDEIVIFNEGGDLSYLSDSSVKVRHIEGRPTYKDFFVYINSICSDEDIHIIANTDITFDRQIEVLNDFDWKNKCIALSRWEYGSDGKAILFNRNDSQDSWIFKGKIKQVNGDFHLGLPRCDNRILYELKFAGYQVINPSVSIRSYHFHQGLREEYAGGQQEHYVLPPYDYLYPHNLFGFFKLLSYNLSHTTKIQGYKYDFKKVNRWYLLRFIRKVFFLFSHRELPLIGYK